MLTGNPRWRTRLQARGKTSFDHNIICTNIYGGYAIIADDMTVVDRTKQAFNTLSELFEWYQHAFFIAISSSFKTGRIETNGDARLILKLTAALIGWKQEDKLTEVLSNMLVSKKN